MSNHTEALCEISGVLHDLCSVCNWVTLPEISMLALVLFFMSLDNQSGFRILPIYFFLFFYSIFFFL